MTSETVKWLRGLLFVLVSLVVLWIVLFGVLPVALKLLWLLAGLIGWTVKVIAFLALLAAVVVGIALGVSRLIDLQE